MTDPRREDAPSVRIIQGIGRRWHRHRHLVLGLSILAVILLWLATGVYSIDNGESATLRRFGRVVSDRIEPGLHLSLPERIDQVDRFLTGQVYRVEVRGDATRDLSILTGDENIIDIGIVAQYTVTDLQRFLYRSEDPIELIKGSIRTAILETVSTMLVDDVLTSGKAAIQQRVRAEAQAMLREYETGVTLLAVTMRSVDPPREAAGAFRKVSDSRAEAARLINDAGSDREKRLSLARADAVQSIESARVDSTVRLRQAEGAAHRFASLLAQYRREPEQTRIDLYRGQVGDILRRSQTILLAPGETPRIDVHLRRGEKSTP